MNKKKITRIVTIIYSILIIGFSNNPEVRKYFIVILYPATLLLRPWPLKFKYFIPDIVFFSLLAISLYFLDLKMLVMFYAIVIIDLLFIVAAAIYARKKGYFDKY